MIRRRRKVKKEKSKKKEEKRFKKIYSKLDAGPKNKRNWNETVVVEDDYDDGWDQGGGPSEDEWDWDDDDDYDDYYDD
jgi:hypothetical protein